MENKNVNDKREKGSLSYGCIIVALFVALIISACQMKVSTDIPAVLLNEAKMQDMEAINFETFYTDSGVVKYHLQAPKLLVYEDDPKNRYNDFPDGFIMQRYDLNRKIISQMSGNHGKYFVNDKRWEANGNVVLVNSEGDTLRSEELKYNQAEDLIYSDQFVSIKKGDQYITGTGGFKSDTQMSKWSFIKTKGHLYVEGGE
ncbi:MAG: LPS export ABC transporter periplasmic protein LptC [Prolixibacteraceae bacterium]|jgi:LPS export ABC transporter protein LptC|nr:LPS export ABC transporter periplasmic protein LptC [Prolixibacteraceae bacterium]